MTSRVTMFMERPERLQTFPEFQQTIAPSRGQGGQKYSKCMKMSTPTSLWCYWSCALRWKSYIISTNYGELQFLLCCEQWNNKCCSKLFKDGGNSWTRQPVRWNESSETIFLKFFLQNPATGAVRKRPFTASTFSGNINWNEFSCLRPELEAVALSPGGDSHVTVTGVPLVHY